MTPYKQLNLHNPDNGIWGDCMRTAIACLLDREPHTVPHFYDGSVSQDWVQSSINTRKWLKEQGYELLEIPWNVEILEEFLHICDHIIQDSYYMILGTSTNKCNHIVICKGKEIIHDPAQDDSGIIGPADDGYYWFQLIYRGIN